MHTSTKPRNNSRRPWIILILVVGIAAIAAWAARTQRSPLAPAASVRGENPKHTEDAHEHGDEHNHEHAGHSEATSIELSERALKNIGFQPVTIGLGQFERAVTLPAMVIEQAGRTQVHLTAPLTGVIKKVFAVAGEAVEPGSPMFELRLTHEDLVAAQQEFLKNIESLDIVDREIARLNTLGEGVIAGKRIIEQQYEKQKLEAALRATEQALLLHGLNEDQVQTILKSRQLLSSLTIRAPNNSHPGTEAHSENWFIVQSLPVSPGEQVVAGQELCVLADQCELLIEGRAFEDDAVQLRNAAKEGWSVEAKLMAGEKLTETIEGLKILYLADKIDPESRAFRFYIRLPNSIALDQRPTADRRYIEWKFKPGQRMQLRVPVEEWKDCIVLPIDAVIDEGAEMFVYRQNGDHFDRVPIHVEYRDRESVVVANDGALFPSDIVAGQGAYQIHLALKNKSGGGIDPHAGHNH